MRQLASSPCNCDRILIAEADKEKMIILTQDEKFAEYGVQVLW
jgi:PIN domain nuclease of toxin-antitoxin system